MFSSFALLYILAQIVERLTEPISRINLPAWKDGAGTTDANGRAIILWGVASVLGIILTVVLKVGFIQMVGHQLDSGFQINQTLDQILSGIIVGSGTKPLHDLISLIEKSGNNNGK